MAGLLAHALTECSFLTNAVAVGVGREAGDALGLGAADEGAHFVFTHRACAAVVGLQSAFIDVCKETQTKAVNGWNVTMSHCLPLQ